MKNISDWGKSSSAPDMMVELSDSAGRVHVTARGRLGWSTSHCFLGHLLGVHVIAGWSFQICFWCFCMFNTVETYFGRIWDADPNEIYLRGVKSTNINQPDLVGFFSGMEEGSWFWREVRRKPGIQRPCPLGGRRPGCPHSYPLGMSTVCYWQWPSYSGFTHQTWWFSIVRLVYQRVTRLQMIYTVLKDSGFPWQTGCYSLLVGSSAGDFSTLVSGLGGARFHGVYELSPRPPTAISVFGVITSQPQIHSIARITLRYPLVN